MHPLVFYLLETFPLAILFNVPILLVILKKRYLTIPYGVVVAATLGILFFLVHPFFWVVLLVFFFSSSFLSKMKLKDKLNITMDFEKGSTQRDAIQVLANGFVPFLFVIGYFFFELIPQINQNLFITTDILNPFFISVFSSFSVHNADTWATEIGTLSKQNPRLIINLKKKVVPGTSGAVSFYGIIASFLGSLLIALVYFLSAYFIDQNIIFSKEIISVLILVTVGGFLGSLLDSIEGATIQGIYFCNICKKETESNPHPRCGNITILFRGIDWINNDFVNLSSAFFISIFIFMITLVLI